MKPVDLKEFSEIAEDNDVKLFEDGAHALGANYNGKKIGSLTYSEMASFLQSKGCTFGVPLDGGGSSTMYFNGKVLNAARSGQRSVVDFVYFK